MADQHTATDQDVAAGLARALRAAVTAAEAGIAATAAAEARGAAKLAKNAPDEDLAKNGAAKSVPTTHGQKNVAWYRAAQRAQHASKDKAAKIISAASKRIKEPVSGDELKTYTNEAMKRKAHDAGRVKKDEKPADQEIPPLKAVPEAAMPGTTLPEDKAPKKLEAEGSGGLKKDALQTAAVLHDLRGAPAAKPAAKKPVVLPGHKAPLPAKAALPGPQGTAPAATGGKGFLSGLIARFHGPKKLAMAEPEPHAQADFESRKKPSRFESDIKTCKTCGKPYDDHKKPEIQKACGEMSKAAMSGIPAAPKAPAAPKPAAPQGVKAPAPAKPVMGKTGLDPSKPESEKNPPAPRTDADRMATLFGKEPKVLHPSDKKRPGKK